MEDFEHFIAATSILFTGAIPYGKIPFFAPPWTSLFIFPFVLIPKPLNMWIWQFAIIGAVAATCIISVPKSRLFPLLIIFSPPSLLTLIAGQLSGFVALASTCLLLELAGKRRIWLLLICSFIALSKPHLAAVPVAIMLFTLFQKKEYRKVFNIVVFFTGMFLIFELLIPNSTFQWLTAMFSGNYRTGDTQSLQHVALSNGTIISIGNGYYQGSIFILIPAALAYLYCYFKESLTPRIIALTLSIMFLFLPYYRLYDFVMLIYPIGVLYSEIVNEFYKNRVERKTIRSLIQRTSRARIRV